MITNLGTAYHPRFGKVETVIDRHDSVEKFVDYARAKGLGSAGGAGDNWDGGVSALEAARRAVEGDYALAASMQTEITRISPVVGETVRNVTVPHFSGSSVSVPAYLAGDPMCMRRRERRSVPGRAISIYVSNASSAGVRASDLIKRGATILAYIEWLQASQVEVDLHLVGEAGAPVRGGSVQYRDIFLVVRVDTKPLDLATAGFAIAHPAFARHTCYRVEEVVHGSHGEWPSTWGASAGAAAFSNSVRATLGMAPDDVYIPCASYRDTLLSDPEGWLRDRITQGLATYSF